VTPIPIHLTFSEIDPVREAETAAAFLSKNTWPFHRWSILTIDQARQIPLGPCEEVRCFWIKEGKSLAGIMRIFDLEDADEGSVLLDLRIAEECRGRGIGRTTIAWAVEMLFCEYPALHRIEAATRIDNHAMRRVLESNRFVLEGRLRETWLNEDGTRYDTALYGRLRSDA
jgi:[ribosomal protein S5]-alanine N-acetyltransferase